MKYKIILVIFIIGLAVSLILSFEKQPAFCGTTEGCDSVNNSQYGSTLGIKNSYYGIGIFTLMFLFTILHIKNPTKNKRLAINFSIILGSAISLYFIYIQMFILKTYCRYCLVIDISLLLALLLVLFTWKK